MGKLWAALAYLARFGQWARRTFNAMRRAEEAEGRLDTTRKRKDIENEIAGDSDAERRERARRFVRNPAPSDGDR